MIAHVLALALLATRGEEIAAPPGQGPVLALDPCLQVDEAAVQNLVELELGGARLHRETAPISVVVRCIDGAQEIRVEPWASRGDDGIRTIALPDAEDATATLEARSRELALAIAELIRRLEITRPLPAPAPPPPPPPPTVVAPPSPPELPPGRWGLGALSSFEYITGGQWLAGGDLAATVAVGRWTLGEVRLGGRVLDGQAVPYGRLTAHAGTAGLGAGLQLWSNRRVVGFVAMLRAQGYGVEYRAELAGDGTSGTARFVAVVIAVEPRLLVAITRRLSIAASGAAGVPLHGIVVRTQGVETDSMSGVVLSGSLGLVVTL